MVYLFKPHCTRFSESWLGIFYMGLAVNAITFVVRAELFRRYSANTVSTFLFLTPVIGLVLGHLFLGEPLTRAVGLGAIVVFFGSSYCVSLYLENILKVKKLHFIYWNERANGSFAI